MSRTCTRRALRDERGSFLLEVLISAFLLVLLTGGAIAAFDTAAHQSGHQRAQAVAANLAATEMERLRTVKFSDLNALDVTHPPKQVDGTSYTIRSQTTEAFNPQAAGAGCDTSSRSPQALRATTTVSWGGMGVRQPVRVSSIIAAPASANSSRGNFTVQVLDKDGLGVNGLTIQLQGPSSVSGATDENGCVRFTDLIPDNGYHLLFSRAGWRETPRGIQDIDDVVSVAAGQTMTKGYQYDLASTITATFQFRNKAGAMVAAPVSDVTWTHASLPAGVQTQAVSPRNHVVTSPPLAASGTPYGVYADKCPSAAPSPPRPGDSALAGNNVTVTLPTLRIFVYSGGPVAGAQVFVWTPCGTRISVGTTDALGEVYVGMPYGTIQKVCAQASGFYGNVLNVSNRRYHPAAVNQANFQAPIDGSTVQGPFAGSCPAT